MRVIWVGVAGFAGAVSRYLLGGLVAERARGAFPWGTFTVNVSGSLALGVVFVLLAERLVAPPTVRTALTIGFLGAYTTFSTLSFETMRLIEDGAILIAILNMLASMTAGLAAVYVGTWLGRAL